MEQPQMTSNFYPLDQRVNMMQQPVPSQQPQRSQPQQRRSQPPLTKSKSTQQAKHGKKNRISQTDHLSLLVVPMEQDRDIYQMELKINGNQQIHVYVLIMIYRKRNKPQISFRCRADQLLDESFQGSLTQGATHVQVSCV